MLSGHGVGHRVDADGTLFIIGLRLLSTFCEWCFWGSHSTPVQVWVAAMTCDSAVIVLCERRSVFHRMMCLSH
ncbi:hypothetical protein AF72_01250 [Xylella taiwanensis]|uniref:Uncharacterized protein n=1 Tax=Xylella taiwanensis TaxID=1444770 RepID=Z9JML2_9GAMM|nr:hypothetical protein [Xylella taiwanensis]AXI83357.1 hypothetical protein AB672_05095 [Xylella taiwanensis]EWS79238.1 hypothetical protein AF72_01250 [Xylella taiwanensis]MCD8460966.1 hypothetical protein [Xylella taiwanensis]UFN24787.1 hypothetical protein LPH62_10880 [Xylella taiwanensis]